MTEISKNKTEVIVVGGGPAGIACAVTVARAGHEVVLIERGSFAGSKNVFGGAIYAQPTREIFPDFEKDAPIERLNVAHKFAILGEDDSTMISYRRKDTDNPSYSVIRGKFDRWMAEQAKKEGVILVEETVVRELLIQDEKVVGVKTELEEYYADIVVLADGVNSLLAKQIGFREKIEPKDVALSVKEVIKLGREKINERFNITDDEGCIYEIFGGPMLGMLGLGFIYTNKESVSIGLGVGLDALCEKNLKPYEVLEELKKHPAIAPLIKDGELLEYSAHLIPEGGYKKIPTLFGAGVMIAGDAAMLVNNLHWEGTNLAMISGKIAGETALKALARGDFSEKMLSRYQKELENSFVMKDLKTYRNLMDEAHNRSESFMDYYLREVNGFFRMFTTVDSIPKREKFRKFIFDFIKKRNIIELIKDAFSAFKLLWSILIK
ncbi:FAD-dependent oxidoreductase [bacterium]|uniref:FAD-dependent oxidoreductase n=1 Tax=Candidatus Scatenecus faecavium TaxID=2840915 RepID=A0A9D1FX35_9BACT|nr:FAD-dependent oxidoreductase [bacterium]HIS83314.1 FAD-dependent oxidoreductase [Candidatus Scatenecus faecavium]